MQHFTTFSADLIPAHLTCSSLRLLFHVLLLLFSNHNSLKFAQLLRDYVKIEFGHIRMVTSSRIGTQGVIGRHFFNHVAEF